MSNKKKLSLAALSVKSFVTSGEIKSLNTVKGGAIGALPGLPIRPIVWLTQDDRHICKRWPVD